MRVSIVGAGYVGLVTGAGLAAKGHQVVCIDSNEERVAQITRGESPIHEPGLGELLRQQVPGRLAATTDLSRAVLESDLSIIAVGTPSVGGEIDLASVRMVAGQIGRALAAKSGYHAVVVKSTVIPGTTEDVVLPLLEEASGKRAGKDFGVGMNPEFLTEGEAVHDFLEPDRIVLGGIDAGTLGAMEELYAAFDGVERVKTTPRTAELIKYASNALLATLISFSNEIGNFAAAVGVDAADVMAALHSSRYLSHELPDGSRHTAPIAAFLWPGCGFGGSCLPKDVQALIAQGAGLSRPLPLLEAVLDINKRQPGEVLARLHRHFPSLSGVRVTVLGLAFRPDTNDMRESPAIPIVRGLLAEGARLAAYDPAAKEEARRLLPAEVRLCDSLEDALRDAEAVVLVTRWEEFRGLPQLLRKLKSPPLFVDGRRMLSRQDFSRYDGIGL